jgi:4,5-DOPA dioxygenase extradiol
MISPIFVGHGSPMMAIQDNACSQFLEEYGRTLHPKAVVLFTAHWESEVTRISSADGVYETIHDFGGFPQALFDVEYPAKGSPETATKVAKRMEEHGLPYALETTRGLDHGSWVVLKRIFPDATIPVVQVSIHPFLPPAQQFTIGEALRGLDEEDILIVGSGATVHNFGYLNMSARQPDAWAVEFDEWLVETIQKRDLEALFNYEEQAPNGKRAVPRPDHFVPLFLAMGSGDPGRTAEVIHRSYEYGSLSYISFEF